MRPAAFKRPAIRPPFIPRFRLPRLRVQTSLASKLLLGGLLAVRRMPLPAWLGLVSLLSFCVASLVLLVRKVRACEVVR